MFPGKVVSLTSFGLVNAGIDMQFVDAVITGQPLPTHGDLHTFIGVLIVGTLAA